jgi:hypothetical protein
VLVVLSQETVNSRWMTREVCTALQAAAMFRCVKTGHGDVDRGGDTR